MKQIVFSTLGSTPALIHARNRLQAWGYAVANSWQDTSVTHILLPVPTADTLNGMIGQIPPHATLLGGMLPPLPCQAIDLLQDEFYLAENAAITAHCAISLTLRQLQKPMSGLPVLVIGWGRIGKCLCQSLRGMGAEVTMAVRKESDAAMLQALGFHAGALSDLSPDQYNIIYNTAPNHVLDEKDAHPDAILIDLASQAGISGERVIWARGLPNKMMPESSGMLIAKTALRYALRKE